MKLVTKSGTEYSVISYEESYSETNVNRTVTFSSNVNLASAIQDLTEDELSEARIEHPTTTVELPPVKIETGYRYISADSAPMSSISLVEVE